MQKGSYAWMRAIADILEPILKGIELSDYRNSSTSVSPVVQLQFVVPASYDLVPDEVNRCTSITGFRGLYFGSRGGDSIHFVTFDFYSAPFPDLAEVEKLTVDLGFNLYESRLNTPFHFQRSKP